MRCPECGAASRAQRNEGGKRTYASFYTRYYKCEQCGQKYLTQEIYLRDVSPYGDKQRATETIPEGAEQNP